MSPIFWGAIAVVGIVVIKNSATKAAESGAKNAVNDRIDKTIGTIDNVLGFISSVGDEFGGFFTTGDGNTDSGSNSSSSENTYRPSRGFSF